MKEKTNNVVKKEAGNIIPADDKTAAMEALEDMGFSMGDNFIGVRPRLPMIKIIHAGQIFVMPSEEKIPEFEGIILDSNLTNAYWKSSFEDGGAGEMPDCYSYDGILPDPECETRQAKTCAECPFNKFGSDGKRGKACKNMRRVHILRGDNLLPDRLTLPATSLAGYDEYMYKLADLKRPYNTVVTKVALEKATNKDNIEYSKIKFSHVANINDIKELKKISDIRVKLAEQMHKEEITAEEYKTDDLQKDEDPFS